MPLPDFDVSVGHSFGFEFDGVVIKQIQKIDGLKFTQGVIELKEQTPDGKYIIKKLPGRQQPGEVTMTRGLTDNKSFADWVQTSQFGKMMDARKGGSIIVYDYEGAEIRRFKLTNAWPKDLAIGSMEAGGGNVLTEAITIVFEAIENE